MTFKTCSCCGQSWPNQEAFLSEKALELVGYKADFEKLEYGLFFFNHNKQGCGSTITMGANDFLNLYNGPVYKEKMTGTKDCPGYCRQIDQLARCDVKCECAFVREIVNLIMVRHGPSSGDSLGGDE